MASAQLAPCPNRPRCTDSHCSRFATKFVQSEPWTHHLKCSDHLFCHRNGPHCPICSDWEMESWDQFEAVVARLARRRERRRASGHQADDADTTSEDGSVRSEPPSMIFEPSPPAAEVEVQASSPVRVDRLPTGQRGNTPSRPSGSETSSEEENSDSSRPPSSSKMVKKGGSSKHSSSKSPGSKKGGSKRSSSHSYPIDHPSDSHGRGRKSAKGQDRDVHTSKERSSSPLHSKSRSRSETGTAAVFRSPPPVDRTRTAPVPTPPGFRPLDPQARQAQSVRFSAPAPGLAFDQGQAQMPFPASWQLSFMQFQAMQEAMRNVPYTFPGQPQPPSERPGPAANPQPKSSVLQSTQPSQPSLGPGPRQVNPPPGLSTTEWAAIQRMRENVGSEVSRPAAPSPTRSASPSPESDSDSEGMLSEHEDFVELRAAPGLSELDRELQGSPVRPTRADEPAPPVVAPRPPASLTSSSPSFVEDFDDLRGDASAWRKTWLADKFRFRIPTRFHEILFMVKQALGFPPDPQEENAPVPAQSQARSLFQGVPHVAPSQYVSMPWDDMCHLTAKRDTKGLLDGSSKSLGEAVFSRKFPAGRSNEASFLTPQSIDQEAEKHFRMWVKKDFSSKKPFGSDSSSHLAVAERLSVRLDERLATLNRLSALLIQIQAYIQHATAEQAKLWQSLREDPATPIPGLDENFSPSTVLDAMEFAAFLTASISRISLHIQAEVRMDRRARLVNHLRPDQGMAGIPSFTKRRLLDLPLDTETMFAGQFDEVLKETTGTQAVAVQAAQIARGSPPVGLSSFKIPKRPATQSKGQGPPKKKAKKGKSPSPQQQQQRDPQPPQQSSGPAREPTQRNFPPSSFSGSRGRGRGRGGSRPQ